MAWVSDKNRIKRIEITIVKCPDSETLRTLKFYLTFIGKQSSFK